jgi:predicted secreted hydrolase
VTRGRALRFRDDEGSHPAFRIVWWYVTGLLHAARDAYGFQITFFRARPEAQTENPSAFAPRQLLVAHAALTDISERRLLHRQRAAREGFGLADALEGRTAVWIDDWRLEQQGREYRLHVPPEDFGFDLALAPSQPPMLNGERGYSRKGPRPESASYYYSIPQIDVRGSIVRGARRIAVTGKAWLDHEWSSSYLDERARGWDWIGMNLADGGALMAFRIRARDGSPYWAGATLRTADGRTRTFDPREIRFDATRLWQSPRTGTRYPVAWRVALGDAHYTAEAIVDDQEQDARATTGAVYWEGPARLEQDGRELGAGYLELTGYWRKLTL